MKTRRAILASLALASSGLILGSALLQAATTIDPVQKYAYGANIGWLNWYADGADGAVIGQKFCSGYIYAANVGWINLGNGSPANGMSYSQSSAADSGVNVDGGGYLTGYAWGANIGWINFGLNYPGNTGLPMVDPTNGQLSGYIWSANCGWISLNSGFGVLNTPPASQLLVLLPGQSPAPGTAPGKTGTPYPQVAGTAFNVTVNAVNAYFNLISTNSANPTMSISSSDPGAILPANQPLVNGTANFIVTLKTTGFQTVTAMDAADNLAQGVSSPIPVNAVGTPGYDFVGITSSPTSITVAFAGIPGATYVIQGAPTPMGPWTYLAGDLEAPADGIIQYNDMTYASSGSFFFRAEYISGP
jgi:hypothetical protein